MPVDDGEEHDYDADFGDIDWDDATFSDDGAPAFTTPMTPPVPMGLPPTSPVATQAPRVKDHRWSDEVASLLEKRFRMAGFRPIQEEVVNAALSGRNTFVLLPTGGGKSLCYQLPALCDKGATSGVTIVISPLKSLIQDQVQNLLRLGINAASVNGENSDSERKTYFSMLESGTIRLFYVTPEMLCRSPTLLSILRRLAQRRAIARFVIDEAHLLSQWGRDFREDYVEVGKLIRREFATLPIMALTATATHQIRSDILAQLHMPDAQCFVSSFNRPNLFYEVRPKTKWLVKDMGDFIKGSYPDSTGIIYCPSRVECEKTAAALEKMGIAAHYFHASMAPKDKSRIQQAWTAGEIKVVCATIAFGVGIDKAVRLVSWVGRELH